MLSILWFKTGVLIVRQFKVSNVGIVVEALIKLGEVLALGVDREKGELQVLVSTL